MQLEKPDKQQQEYSQSTYSEVVSITLLHGEDNNWTPEVENAPPGS